jgi:hypothetical protein
MSRSDGAKQCTPCPLGFYSQNASATACEACLPPFYTSSVATRQCSSCNAGLYAVFANASAGVFRECRFCPEGASCPALSDMTISPLYYATRDPVSLAVDTYLCDGGRCAADFTCSPNRVAAADNPLCGRCLPGHSEWAGVCMACPSVNGALVFGLLLLAWVCVLAIHGFAQRSSTGSALRIAMFFWQVSFLIAGGAAWARWAAFLELNFLTASSGSGVLCPFPVSPQGSLVLQLLGPLLSFALLAATAALHRGLGQARQRACARLARFEPAAYWRTVITLYFFTFNSVTRACLDFFDCTTLPSGHFMVALPAVRCDEAAYRGLVPLAVFLLLVYAAVAPGFIGFRLREAHRRQALERAEQSEFARVWSVMYGPLRAEAYWWSMAQMLARGALVAAAVYLRSSSNARYAVFALLNGVSVVIATHLRPNRSATDNAWELGTLSALALLALSAIMSAPDAWMALLVLGVGAAIAVRLGAQGLRRLVQGGARGTRSQSAEEPSASPHADGGALVMAEGTSAYVPLKDDA